MIALRLTSTLIFTAVLTSCSATVPLSDTKLVAVVPDKPVAQRVPTRIALVTGNFQCELGNRVEVSTDPQRPNAINLSWKGQSYPLQAVATSTGALRYEDPASGHVWIQIPAKSILLNAKAGQQLANECKSR